MRDLTGDYHGRNIESLVRDGSWRALARYARDTLVSRQSTDIRTTLEVNISEYLRNDFVVLLLIQRSTALAR